MQYTDNYNLKKPDLTDRYSVGDFNDNADGIDAALKGLEDDKVNTSDVINNLTSTSTTSPLSAAQGKALNDTKLEKSSVVNNLTSDSTTDPLSAAQGKALNTNKIATSAIANNLTTTTEGYVLDARQGKTLNDGKLSTTGDSANNTVGYTSADDASVFNSGNLGGQSAYAWTATAKIATGEKHSVLFNKISTMFKNIRTIAKLIGTTDISAVGDGTVSGAIGTLSSDLSELNSKLSKIKIKRLHTAATIQVQATSGSGFVTWSMLDNFDKTNEDAILTLSGTEPAVASYRFAGDGINVSFVNSTYTGAAEIQVYGICVPK